MTIVSDAQFDEALNEGLLGVLRSHGVDARRDGDAVVVGPSALRARLALAPRPVTGGREMTLAAQSPDGVVVTDQWVALGEDANGLYRDGMQAFCTGDFHVLLAGLWGLLETDQVDHVVVDGWDMYLGGWVGRTSAGASMPPADGFWDWWMGAVPGLLEGPGTRWVRLFVGSLNGERTHEVLVDGVARPDLEAGLAACGWVPTATGYASRRLFVVLRRQASGPNHERTGTCA